MGMIYWDSMIRHGGAVLFIAKEDGEKSLYVQYAHGVGDDPGDDPGEAFDKLEGRIARHAGGDMKICPLSNANAGIIRELFPFTRPVSHRGHPFTLGLGDRLGIASPGHIRLIRELDVFPVLAQQSIRELNLTNRTYDDVLSAAVWAVFQEGYRKGYGADGDHLKTRDEVMMALDCGFSMITLDCSEHIPNGLGAVVEFAIAIYHECLRGKDVDFELSIDETQTVTSPEDHLYVASEFKKAGVDLVSLAPRFCGEFQKGIDYRGDVRQFEREFALHASIAREMGYKLSIHSGSDKFAVFPAIYRETGKNVHVKTAGTNWLEAVRVIAQNNPALFRALLPFALTCLHEAKKYYHITENTDNVPDIDPLDDSELPSLLDRDDVRQVVHVTYGHILSAKNPDGAPTFRDDIFRTLNRHEADYYVALGARIGRHLPG